MKELFYSDIEDLCLDVSEVHDKLCENNDFVDVTIVAKYEVAKQIISELVYYDYDLCNIKLENPDIDYYDDEFYISINSDNEIWCEKAKDKDGNYLIDECDIALIHEDCNSKLVSKLRSDYEPMIFVLSDDCDEDMNHCSNCENKEKCDSENDGCLTVGIPVIMKHDEDDNTKWFSFHKDEDGKSIDISLHVTDNIKQDELKYIFDNLIYI